MTVGSTDKPIHTDCFDISARTTLFKLGLRNVIVGVINLILLECLTGVHYSIIKGTELETIAQSMENINGEIIPVPY